VYVKESTPSSQWVHGDEDLTKPAGHMFLMSSSYQTYSIAGLVNKGIHGPHNKSSNPLVRPDQSFSLVVLIDPSLSTCKD
jgi:hypothetical protein